MAKAAWLKLSLSIAAISALGGCVELLPPEQPAATAPTPPALPPAPKPTPPQVPPKLLLSDLARYAPAEIQTVIGAPSLKRMEGAMQVLQFTSGTCITDLVYNENAQLIHVEARAKTGIPIEIQPCLDSFPQKEDAIKRPAMAMPAS